MNSYYLGAQGHTLFLFLLQNVVGNRQSHFVMCTHKLCFEQNNNNNTNSNKIIIAAVITAVKNV